MSTTALGRGTNDLIKFPDIQWERPRKTYQCEVILCPEPEGGYSAHAVGLAGVVSEGDTIDGALANFIDALKATIAYHLEAKSQIPWRDGDPDFFSSMTNTIKRWVTVDV